MSAAMINAPRTQRMSLGRLVATAILALAAGTAVPAMAQGMPGGPHGMMDGHPMDGPGMMMGHPEHMGRMIDHMLDGLKATDAQRAQIKQIAQAAAADLRTQHEAGRALHEKGMQIFAAPTIDTAAAEALRQQMLALHDQASKRVLQAMLDVAKVLTPEQRAKLGERMNQRAEMMRERMQRLQHGPEQKS